MPDMPSITLVKTIQYRGQTEEWSNTYHFAGGAPANAAAWRTLADNLQSAEAAALPATVKFAKYYGYEAGNEHSVYQFDFIAAGSGQPTGTMSAASGQRMAGDQAMTIRALVGTSSRGKNVYIRKYFHGGLVEPTNPDALSTGQKTQLQNLAAALVAGTGLGTFRWCGPQGATATAPLAQTFVTTRTLKRRGKRP